MSSACPFAKGTSVNAVCPMRSQPNQENDEREDKGDDKSNDSDTVSPKCPYGFDSQTFKLGPLSCMICQSLLFESSKCMPCSHKFCKVCISRFNDCPLCGADIEKIEPDKDLQVMVDRFIDGHARIKRSQINTDTMEGKDVPQTVIYGDVSMERGSFLVQQAMRAFRGQNIESAKSRLSMCAEDIRKQLETLGQSSELCSQLGAVLGMLGDCSRAMGDAKSAIAFYEESVEFLLKLPATDIEVVDFAVSLAKVADVDRNLGNEDLATNGFKEAISCLESLNLSSNDVGLEQKRKSVLEFLNKQLAEKRSSSH